LATPFSIKCEILADLWMDYRDEEEFMDFIEYNDLGLPVAYAIANKIVDPLPMSEQFVNETFDLFLGALGVEDSGFETINDVFEAEAQ